MGKQHDNQSNHPCFEGIVEKVVLDSAKGCFKPPIPGEEIRHQQENLCKFQDSLAITNNPPKIGSY